MTGLNDLIIFVWLPVACRSHISEHFQHRYIGLQLIRAAVVLICVLIYYCSHYKNQDPFNTSVSGNRMNPCESENIFTTFYKPHS